MATLFFIAVLAVVLDLALGEPKHFHPVKALGHMAQFLQNHLITPQSPKVQRIKGIIAVALLLWPVVLLVLLPENFWGTALGVLVLFFCISPRSLVEHGLRAYQALQSQQLEEARDATANLVSRDVAHLDGPGLSRAVTESLLENGSDAVFAPLFWFFVAGPAGAAAYRVINTLDAMWGYRHEPFTHFGWFAARLDDVANYIPARITAVLYLLAKGGVSLFPDMRRQAVTWDSPNAGYAIAAGAWSLGLRLGGNSLYQGKEKMRPVLGNDKNPGPGDIRRANALILRSLITFLLITGIISVFA